MAGLLLVVLVSVLSGVAIALSSAHSSLSSLTSASTTVAGRGSGAEAVLPSSPSPDFTVSVSASPPSVDVLPTAPGPGDYSTTLTASTQGTVGAVGYTWTGLPPGCSSVDLPQDVCSPTQTGTYQITVIVQDSTLEQVPASLTLTVDPDPTIVAIVASPLAGPLPFYTHLSAAFNGGSPPYTYNWTFGDGSNYTNLASPTHEYYVVGHYQVRLVATDAAGGVTSASLTVAVVRPLSVSLAINPYNNTYSQANVDFNVTIVNSSGLFPYTYTWTGLPSGCPAQDSPELSCSPTAPGTFEVTVTVTDAANEQATATEKLILRSIPANPPSQPTSSALPNIALVGLVGLAVFLGVVVGITQLGREAPPSEEPTFAAPAVPAATPPPDLPPAAPPPAVGGGETGPPDAVPEGPPPSELPPAEEFPPASEAPPVDTSSPESPPPDATPPEGEAPVPPPDDGSDGAPPPPPPEEPPAPSF